MIDPATIAASAIAKLAFDEFVKSGAGEAAKKTVGGAIELVKALRDRIKAKFEGNERAAAAFAEMERDGSEAALEKVSKYLDLEMDEEEGFADEVRQIAHQIINIQNQSTTQIKQQNINYGRDQFVINQPGNVEIAPQSAAQRDPVLKKLLGMVQHEVKERLAQSLHRVVDAELLNLGKALEPHQVRSPWTMTISVQKRPPHHQSKADLRRVPAPKRSPLLLQNRHPARKFSPWTDPVQAER
jgi:hypothetical protein